MSTSDIHAQPIYTGLITNFSNDSSEGETEDNLQYVKALGQDLGSSDSPTEIESSLDSEDQDADEEGATLAKRGSPNSKDAVADDKGATLARRQIEEWIAKIDRNDSSIDMEVPIQGSPDLSDNDEYPSPTLGGYEESEDDTSKVSSDEIQGRTQEIMEEYDDSTSEEDGDDQNNLAHLPGFTDSEEEDFHARPYIPSLQHGQGDVIGDVDKEDNADHPHSPVFSEENESDRDEEDLDQQVHNPVPPGDIDYPARHLDDENDKDQPFGLLSRKAMKNEFDDRFQPDTDTDTESETDTFSSNSFDRDDDEIQDSPSNSINFKDLKLETQQKIREDPHFRILYQAVCTEVHNTLTRTLENVKADPTFSTDGDDILSRFVVAFKEAAEDDSSLMMDALE
ncbi:hypothetical protein M231_04291 [Tremella mesenterica]|uniref:Uncharacterized protein n=1 Tax=Tremella mesenterica TaxID=5217 RepID=A0A4Q1BL75_TREME|nr:hypothetical protein M231_04291 [Tremella mesenterica]